MAYRTYTTMALVCGSRNHNTADRSYRLFTRELGMLYATARSVREERSRQRCALQDFSLIRVSLVRGKQDWRVGSVEGYQNYYQQAADRAARGSVTGLMRLLRRFVQGELSDQVLFDYITDALALLANELPERTFVQQVLEVRLLSQLGYVDIAQLPETLLTAPIECIHTYSSSTLQQQIVDVHTHALSISHL